MKYFAFKKKNFFFNHNVNYRIRPGEMRIFIISIMSIGCFVTHVDVRRQELKTTNDVNKKGKVQTRENICFPVHRGSGFNIAGMGISLDQSSRCWIEIEINGKFFHEEQQMDQNKIK